MASAPSTPRVFAGRFCAVSLLKTGQDIETWIGEDRADGRPAIIKTVPAATLPRSERQRLTQQAKALGSITSPFLTAPLQIGLEDGVVYAALPFVHGVTLEERLCTGPLAIRDAIGLGCRLMKGLVAAHGAGVLHKNIKPTNVIINPDFAVRRTTLIDFGFARSGRIDSSIRDQPVSDVRYVSPEQAGLLEVNADERSDLYSAGVVLFECLAGRPPFTGSTVTEVLRQHMTATPPELRTLGLPVPRALDEVLQRLLRKDPRDRYHSAAGVVADLSAIEEALDRGDTDPAIAIGSRDQRPTLTEPAFVGRAGELAALGSEVERARHGHGRLVLMQAESGGGKTRILQELSIKSWHNAWVLRGQGVADEAPRPFQMLVGVADQIMAVARAEPDYARALRHRLADDRDAVCAAVPELADVLQTTVSGSIGPEAFGEARSVNALSALLDALGSPSRPALVILDDAQWADELMLGLLRHWHQRRQAKKGRDHVAVVVSFRSDEVAADHPLRQIEDATLLTLAPLSAAHIRQMAESMAGVLPEEAQSVVEQLSGGSPFMASAVLRGLVECGALVHETAGWRVEPLALDDVRSSRQAAAFLSRRLERLPAPLLQLLGVGAVLGKEFDLDLAASLARQSTTAAIAAIDEVRRRHIIWIRTKTGRCAFVHDKLREALLGRLHGKAAMEIEAQDRERCFEIAYHFDEAGEPQRALLYALTAGDQARAQHALGIAEQQFRIAIRGALTGENALRMRAAEGLGDVLTLRGQYDEAATELEAARALAGSDVDRARIEGKLGDLAFKRGDTETACTALERGLRLLGRPPPRTTAGFFVRCLWEVLVQTLHTLLPRLFVGRRRLDDPNAEDERLAMRLYSRMAHAYWFARGRIPCAWTHLRGMNLAERYPPTAELAQAYSEHAPVVTMLPAFKRGIAYAQKSLAIRRDLGDIWGQGQSLHFYGVVLYGASQFEACIARCREAVRLLERTGDRWELNTAAWHIAFSQYRLGDLKAAQETARRVHRDQPRRLVQGHRGTRPRRSGEGGAGARQQRRSHRRRGAAGRGAAPSARRPERRRGGRAGTRRSADHRQGLPAGIRLAGVAVACHRPARAGRGHPPLRAQTAKGAAEKGRAHRPPGRASGAQLPQQPPARAARGGPARCRRRIHPPGAGVAGRQPHGRGASGGALRDGADAAGARPSGRGGGSARRAGRAGPGAPGPGGAGTRRQTADGGAGIGRHHAVHGRPVRSNRQPGAPDRLGAVQARGAGRREGGGFGPAARRALRRRRGQPH